jgi:amidase
LYRIRKFESDSTLSLNSIIALNPDVLREAREKDHQKKTIRKRTFLKALCSGCQFY